jgi:hypothetical protein
VPATALDYPPTFGVAGVPAEETRRAWDGHQGQYPIEGHEAKNKANAITQAENCRSLEVGQVDQGLPIGLEQERQ